MLIFLLNNAVICVILKENNKAMLPMNRNEKLAKSISIMNKALSMCDEKSNPFLHGAAFRKDMKAFIKNNKFRGIIICLNIISAMIIF